MKKNKLNAVAFLAVLILFSSFLIFPFKVKAEATILVYDLITSDTTPIIRGTVGDASVSVFVAVGENAAQEAVVLEDGSWSLQFGELASGNYAVGVAAVIGGETISDSAYLFISEEYPLEFYYEESGESLMTSLILFPEEYTYSSEDGNFSITFPADTEVTKTGGGDFDLSEWYTQSVDFNNERVLLELRFGVPDIGLSFSKDINITFNVGEEYNGQILHIFSRSEGDEDEGWEPMDISCSVSNGSCSFNTSHASYFAISQYTSIAETEEGMNDDGEENQKARIDSWKAYQYRNTNGVSCPDKLVLEIKGRHFDEDAEVKIGNEEAYSVKKRTNQKIVARFCMSDLLKIKTGNIRSIKVINPDTETEKADKKINLARVDYKKFSVDDLNVNTFEGILNIQRALISLDFLNRQYDTGFYGSLTKSAVMEFQKQNGISQTGYVGPLTRAGLAEALK